MDLYHIIGQLWHELRRVDRAIARLEDRQRMNGPRSTRGRKSMPPEERAEVSRRMKAYWATKRRGLMETKPPENAANYRE